MLGEDGSCMAIGEECAEKTLRGGEGGEGVSSCGPWRHSNALGEVLIWFVTNNAKLFQQQKVKQAVSRSTCNRSSCCRLLMVPQML